MAKIESMGQLMNLAKALKKMDLTHDVIDQCVASYRTELMVNNREEYNKYINLVGCKSGINKEYGCFEYSIYTNHGGSIKISDWRDVENSGSSIATIHISNGWGLGGGRYLNNHKDIDKEIASAKQITWINKYEMEFLITALEELKK